MATQKQSNCKKYYTYLARKRFPIPCPYDQCGVSVILNQFERHCTDQHSLNSKLCCVWCQGKVFWKPDCKRDHSDHLETCMKIFISQCRHPSAKREAPLPPPPFSNCPRLMNLRPLTPSKIFFDYADGEVSALDSALEHFQLLDAPPPLLSYQEPTLNLALSYLQAYLETPETHIWIHVMVKRVAFPSFVRALNEDQGKTRTLRFSCWCNGGPYAAERHRQHRHLLLRTPRDSFENLFWKKIRLEDSKDKPCPKFPCKRARKIQSPLHFVNTMGYLSHRKSRCQFSFKKEERKKGPVSNHHFYIFESLPVDYRRILVGGWENGIYQLLYMERFQHISVPRLTEKPVVFQNSQWKQKIKDFYNLPKGEVLPVDKTFAPTTRVTPYLYHLMDGHTLYFESDPKNGELSEEEWLWKQAKGGNCFYEIIGEHFWIPRPQDQERLNENMPYILRIQKLNEDFNRYQQKHEEEITGLKKRCEALEEKVTGLKRRCKTLEEENKKWKSEKSSSSKKVIQIINY